MTNRIQQAFAQARSENRAALVAYVCAGDPDVETTLALLKTVSEAGADVIELGVPFSDPTADGVVIQRAAERALAGGMTLAKTLACVQAVRAQVKTPILLFGYYNPFLAFGPERLMKAAKEAGVDGFLIVDLPPEADDELLHLIREQGLAYVPLIAPTSTTARVEAAKAVCTGFLYYVSVTGVTGANAVDLGAAAKMAKNVAEQTKLPVAVGFGIKTKSDVAAVSRYADGAVVGSAIVKTMEDAKDTATGLEQVRTLVSALRDGTERG